MNKLLDFIESKYMDDPVIFQWVNMRRRGKIDDELAVINLIQALVANKNMAIKALDSFKNKGKVMEFKRETKR